MNATNIRLSPMCNDSLRVKYSKVTVSVFILLLFFAFKCAAYDNYQHMFRSSLSEVSLLHAVASNPSLLASEGNPTFGVQLPVPLSLTLELNNSALTLPNPLNYLFDLKNIDSWIARMLIESFELDDLSPQEVSSKLSSFSNNDIKLWMTAQFPYLKIASKKSKAFYYGWGFDIVSTFDGYINVPGQVLSVVFSTNKGLQPGNLISFETLRAGAEFVTEIQTGWARAFDVSLNWRDHELFDRVQFGFGLAQRMGHNFYELTADTLYLDYKKRGVMNVKGDILMTSAGLKDDGSTDLLKVNGYGIDMSTGASLQNDYLSIAGSLTKLGVMGWYDKKNYTKVHVSKDSVYLYNLFANEKDTFVNVESGEPENIRYFLSPVFAGLVSVKIPVKTDYEHICAYQLVSLGYRMSSETVGKFGQGYAFSFDLESGIDYGKIPLRLGWTYSQYGMKSSSISIELVNRQLTYDIWYRASGDWLFRAKKGAEFGFCFHIYTGFKPGFKASFADLAPR